MPRRFDVDSAALWRGPEGVKLWPVADRFGPLGGTGSPFIEIREPRRRVKSAGAKEREVLDRRSRQPLLGIAALRSH